QVAQAKLELAWCAGVTFRERLAEDLNLIRLRGGVRKAGQVLAIEKIENVSRYFEVAVANPSLVAQAEIDRCRPRQAIGIAGHARGAIRVAEIGVRKRCAVPVYVGRAIDAGIGNQVN